MKRINVTYKIAFILALVSIAPVIMFSLFAAWRESQVVLEARLGTSEQFARLCSEYLHKDELSAIKRAGAELLKRDASIAGIRIMRRDSYRAFETGRVPSLSQDNSPETQSIKISVVLIRAQKPWGHLTLYYHKPPLQFDVPLIAKSVAMAFLSNFLVFTLSLRRYLNVLDTTKVVPTRVRNTLDTIPDGIVILDTEGNMIVANAAFLNSSGLQITNLIGTSLASLPFIPVDETLPWIDRKRIVETRTGVKALLQKGQELKYFSISCSPIFDSHDKHAGNLISFQDITELELQKSTLMATLKELGESKDRLREQNNILEELAAKDMLTGAMNRRSLFDQIDKCWNRATARRESMSVIMLDVDHFKRLNDQYGHAAGDQVLRDVAEVIRTTLPSWAVFGRYGGEEFCVVLPHCETIQAAEIAESVRGAIDTRLKNPYSVTASLGVASNDAQVETYQAMLERADRALYAAKHSGRNAVMCWNPLMDAPRDSELAPQTHGEKDPSGSQSSITVFGNPDTTTVMDDGTIVAADLEAIRQLAFPEDTPSRQPAPVTSSPR